MKYILACLNILVVMAAYPAGASDVCDETFTRAGGSYDFVLSSQAAKAPVAGVIRLIHITSLPVFDEANPRENNALYRLANRIHIETRADLIRNLLLIHEGDRYDLRLIEESARLLRRQKYLYDADIRVVRNCEGEVDLEVITRDVWSLTADISFDRSGGENNYGLGIRDTNLFGRGTEFSVKAKQDIERDSLEFAYKNNNVRGSRVSTRLGYADNDDGSESMVQVSLPFYALDARRAWIVSLSEFDQVDTQYFRGDDVTEVRNETSDYRASYGFSRGLRDGKVRRWSFGVRYQEFEFSEADELPPPAVFPTDRKLVYPFVEFSAIEDKFERRVNLEQIYRTEDLNTGYQLFMRMGYASESFGSDADRFVFEGVYSDNFIATETSLLGHELEWHSFYNTDTGEEEDVVVDYTIRYLYNLTDKVSYLARLEATWSGNLNSNRQVFLGGDTGARAYDNRFQVGDRKFLFTLERRRFTDYHFFNLIRMGWAVFFDVGRAWDPDVDDPFEDDYLANIGIGLRLTSSKADVGRFLHIDLAFPLTNRDDDDVNSSELTVRLTNRF